MQLALAKKMREEGNLLKMLQKQTLTSTWFSSAPQNSKRTQLFASAEGASEKNCGTIKCCHSEKTP